MDIRLHNTLSNKKETFKPITIGKVGMYHCGPTVYMYPHIGNFRAYVFADTIKRLFIEAGYKVSQVINITDVGHLVGDGDSGEDKMESSAKKQKKTARDIADFYTGVFMDNLKDLNVDTAGTLFPKATDHIPEQIKIIEELEAKGYTYKTSDGIYFDTAKFPDYGKLGHINIAGLREGERIGVNDEKKNPTDFALWKFSPKNEQREQEWQSPWGVGFPGWHIECSAMAMKYLGETFDIHTGGIDHIPVHHNNEIAQSEGSTGHEFVHVWMHNEFMSVDGKKMSKSIGNVYTMADLKEKKINPLAYRYFLLNARYSTPMNFTWESVHSAENAYEKLVAHAQKLQSVEPENHTGIETQMLDSVADDLDTPQAIATLWNALKSTEVTDAQKKSILLLADRLFGLNLLGTHTVTIPEKVLELVEKRKLARLHKDYAASDVLRKEIETLGFTVKDSKDNQEILPL